MSETITIATANTQVSQLLKHPAGLKPFVANKVDVLLMQEVLGISPGELSDRLPADGYQLAHFEATTGLAIALWSGAGLTVDSGSQRSETIQKMSRLGTFAQKYDLLASQRLRARGLISVDLTTLLGNSLSVVTAHPIVFVRPLSRARQVRAISDILHDGYPPTQAIAFGEDANSYPGPRKVDNDMAVAANLVRVALHDETTWRVRGSKHQWAAKVGALVTGRKLSSFDGQLDAMYYRGIKLSGSCVTDIESDHRAIISRFSFE